MWVYVHLAEGFEEIEAVTVADVLKRAGIPIKMVSITGNYTVTGAHEIPVTADILFEETDYSGCIMIVLPGGMPGTTNLAAHKGLSDQLKKFTRENRWIGAICAAPMVLGEMGLLAGRTAVIYPGMEAHLRDARVGKKPVEIDGSVITSKGPGTAMAFSLALVEVIKDKETADALKRAMVLDI